MKINSKLFLIIFSFSLLLNCTSEKETSSILNNSIKNELDTAIKTFNTAFQKGDTITLEKMITSDYIHTNSTSKAIRKNNWLSYLKKRSQEISAGELEILNYKMDQIETVFYGSMAIVTARVQVSSKKDSILKENSYRVTNIWIYESDKWKRAAFHDGKIK